MGLSVGQLPAMAASNGHNSMTSSKTTKRVAVILLESISMKREARDFHKKCGENTVDLHVRTKVPAGRPAQIIIFCIPLGLQF